MLAQGLSRSFSIFSTFVREKFVAANRAIHCARVKAEKSDNTVSQLFLFFYRSIYLITDSRSEADCTKCYFGV